MVEQAPRPADNIKVTWREGIERSGIDSAGGPGTAIRRTRHRPRVWERPARHDGPVTHVHSVPVDAQPEPCETTGRLPAPLLRPYVAGYGGFRSGSGASVRHRVLPLNLTTAIVDLTGEAQVVTGPRETPTVYEQTTWRCGVTIGFTPLGARALLGVAAPDLVGLTVPLADLLGGHDAEIVERLAAAPGWPARFDLLDDLLRGRLVRDVLADPLVTRAWWRLQHDAGTHRVGALAAHFGVSRRHLEVKFRREIGLTPGTVTRIARFQRAAGMLSRHAPLSATAADCGYADQPHLTREIRTMSGLTPTELFAFLQYRDLVRG